MELPALRFEHGETLEMLRATVRDFAAKEIAPRAAEIDASGEYPQDMFDLLRELGLFTLPFPVEYGGSGSTLSGCLAVEELGHGRAVDADGAGEGGLGLAGPGHGSLQAVTEQGGARALVEFLRHG